MARAKRTERSEARRRYRAATAGVAAEDDLLDTTEVPAAAVPRGSRERRPSSTAAPAPATPARAGFLGALRAAAGPVDIRGDLRALPSIVLRSRAAWVPGLAVLATAVALMIPALASNSLVVMAGTVVLAPPPMIISFLAGMLAPRAGWLMGGLLGLFAGIASVIVFNADVSPTPLGFTYVMTTDLKVSIVVSALATSALFGVAVGAFAGFYRRFLNMSAPQRQAARKR